MELAVTKCATKSAANSSCCMEYKDHNFMGKASPDEPRYFTTANQRCGTEEENIAWLNVTIKYFLCSFKILALRFEKFSWLKYWTYMNKLAQFEILNSWSFNHYKTNFVYHLLIL